MSKRTEMRTRYKILLGLAMFFPTICHAQSNCLWLNEATARGILGGAVTMTVNTIGQHTFCEFSSQQGSAIHRIMVSVNLMTNIAKQFPTYMSQCPPKSTPLPSIGNQAVMCSGMTHENAYAEKVVGRVRDQAFIVSVTSSIENDPSLPPDVRRKQANLVAEQVAGALF
jgi:hypothetical protein